MNRKVDMKCRYCGRECSVGVPGEYGGLVIILCDPMEGGCDKYFVTDIRVHIEARSRKIEGEEDKGE